MDPFLAEIRIFGFNFPPKNWAQCNGQLMPLTQNTALFALLGTFYGGDGKSTFALPDLQGSVPIDAYKANNTGSGGGVSERVLGEMGGSQYVTLLQSEMPVHTHVQQASASTSNSNDAAGLMHGRPFGGGALYGTDGGRPQMAPTRIAATGSSMPHNNMQPYLVLNFCICLNGVFPHRQ